MRLFDGSGAHVCARVGVNVAACRVAVRSSSRSAASRLAKLLCVALYGVKADV